MDAILGVLDDRASLPRVVALSGEAGMGKTSLWRAALDAAAERSFRVLSCRTSEAETGFAFAGLADVLAPTADEVLPELPPLQRRALEAALLLGESEVPIDERAVGAACLGALRLVAARSPVCLAVDDLQWLDAASLSALRFALARLEHEPVAALMTIREDVPTWLRRTVTEPRLEPLRIGGLSVGATNELLRSRLDTAFPRRILVRIWETSRGNPFFALELADALQRQGTTLTRDELPIPENLDELLRERLASLGPAALAAARVVAALADPTTRIVESALGRRFDAALDDALAAQVLELDGGHVRLTHPLLGLAVLRSLSPARRRTLHARLAGVVTTSEERARHLALAAIGPDRDIAAALEDAARSAQARGAPTEAAELAEQALVLTPEDDLADARRRRFLAVDRYFVAGDAQHAAALLEDVLAVAAPGSERAVVLVRLGDVKFYGRPREAEKLYRQALVEADGDVATEALAHLRQADLMRWGDGIDAGMAHATRAVEAASRTDDRSLQCMARGTLGEWQFRAGRGIQHSAMEQAVSLERTLPDWPLVSGPTEHLCHQLVWAGELDRGRSLLLEVLDARRAARDAGSEAWTLWNLGLLEWRAGNWDTAERHTAEALDLQAQLADVTGSDEFPAAIVAAHRGRISEARERAVRSIAHGDAEGVEIERSGHSWVLGFIELSLGQPEGALEHLRVAYELRNRFMREPAQRLELGDLLEALVAVGDLGDAERILAEWQPRAEALDRAWALALLARGHGLVHADRGDLDAAFASFAHALDQHARADDPFHEARTMLALGRTQRRAKRRALARATLEDALDRFERLGAPLWAEQTRAELRRIGGRAPSGGELTEGESRIADLVAAGRTNREVAAELFLTQHSVETALTRIYRKLGVRSRAELVRLFAAKT